MLHVGPYLFKFADQEEEIGQIHRLNFQTFILEVPQYADRPDSFLVEQYRIDKYHARNKYVICKKGEKLIGMLSVCDVPPFSIASRLPDPAILTQPGIVPAEIRLLAVLPEERKTVVSMGLFWYLLQHSQSQPWTHFFISGLTGQIKLYRQMGFEDLGPPVPSHKVSFIPMMVRIRELYRQRSNLIGLWQRRLERSEDQGEGTPDGD